MIAVRIRGHFIIARQRAGNAFGIAVVFDFLDELRRRMAEQ